MDRDAGSRKPRRPSRRPHEPIEPTYPAPLGSVAEARAVLAEDDAATSSGGARVPRDDCAQLDAEPGDGLDLNHRPAAARLGRQRRCRPRQDAAFREIVAAHWSPAIPGKSPVLAVPRHKLGDEIVADLAAARIRRATTAGAKTTIPTHRAKRCAARWSGSTRSSARSGTSTKQRLQEAAAQQRQCAFSRCAGIRSSARRSRRSG